MQTRTRQTRIRQIRTRQIRTRQIRIRQTKIRMRRTKTKKTSRGTRMKMRKQVLVIRWRHCTSIEHMLHYRNPIASMLVYFLLFSFAESLIF